MNSNKRFFLNILAAVMTVFGISMLPPVAAALYFKESAVLPPLAAGCLLCTSAGIITKRLTDKRIDEVHPRMTYMTTVLVWMIMIVLTAVVFYHGRVESAFTDAVFKAAAALTATGLGSLDSSIYPHSFQLWRSILNWLGGVGIILTAVSCLSKWRFSGRTLISAEVPGPDFVKLSLTFRRSYRYIVLIYFALTAVHFLLLVIAGMDPFTSVLTSLSNISTAGLQHISSGVITGLSLPVRIIITVFAFLGSINVSFFLPLFIHHRLKHNEEISVYAGRIAITALIIGIIIATHSHAHFFSALGDALMQTVSYISTSGYIVSECSTWPLACKCLIILQVFFGACAVSTGGGIKTARADIAFRTASFGLFSHIHPRAVRSLKYDDKFLKDDQFRSVSLFIAMFMFIYIACALVISLDDKSSGIIHALNYSQAMITNTGTSIAELGISVPAINLSPVSRIVMSFEMLAGRLEIYPVIMLFFRSFWRTDNN